MRSRARFISGALASGVLLVVVAACWRGEETVKERSPTKVAVMYFENHVDPADTDRLGRMLTGLLARELSLEEDVAVVELDRVFHVTSSLGGDVAGNRDKALEVARRTEADTVLLGRVEASPDPGGGAFIAVVDLVAASGERLGEPIQARGRGIDDLFAVAESLGRQMRRSLTDRAGNGEIREVSRLAGLTENTAALKAFVDGEDLLHMADFAAAADRLREATRIDPDFTMALYRRAIASMWGGDLADARRAATAARALSGQLPPSERQLIEAAALFFEGRYGEAFPLLEELHAEIPNQKDVLYILSEMYLHSARDQNVDRAIELMRRVRELDPDFDLLHGHLSLSLAFRERGKEVQELLGGMREDHPQMVSELEEVIPIVLRRWDEIPPPVGPLEGSFAYSPARRLMVTIVRERWQEAWRLVELPLPGGYVGAWLSRYRGDFFVYRGELAKARQAYETSVFEGEIGFEGVESGIPAGAWQGLADLELLRGDLVAARGAASAGLKVQPTSPAAHFHVGRMALADGDRPAAEAVLARLQTMATNARGPMPAFFERGLDAELALADGEAARARVLLEELVASDYLQDEYWTSFTSSGAILRDALARACRALWDQACEAEALEDLLSSGFERVSHPALYVRALFRLGELYLESGDEAGARQSFERFVEFWGDAGWEPAEVIEAREYLAR